jgi:hypothetical protein
MAWIALGLIVVLFGGMAAIFGWLEVREWRKLDRELDAELHEILTQDSEILTRR